jgi:hypothetical protein
MTDSIFLCRFIGGVADAAALGSILSILMKLFPNYVSTIVSWTEMLFGLGYMLGLKIILIKATFAFLFFNPHHPMLFFMS